MVVDLRNDAAMERRQIDVEQVPTPQASSDAGDVATGVAVILDDATVAALIEYGETLRSAFETLRAKGYRIVDGILVSPSIDV